MTEKPPYNPEKAFREGTPYLGKPLGPQPPPHPGLDPRVREGKPNGQWQAADPGGLTAEDLMELKLPKPEFIVPDILPQGLALLVGAPKIGKSWFALQLADSVSRGTLFLGKIQVQSGAALVLALEDNWLRLQQRMAAVLQGEDASPNLHLRTEWPPFDQGGLDLLAKWIEQHEAARLIVVDTWQRVRAQPKRDSGAYEADYAALATIKKITDPLGLCLLMLHHRRKMSSPDPLETILGSTAIPGAVDTNLVIDRERSKADAILHCHGRDILDNELAMSFQRETGLWSLLGPAKDYRESQARKDIFNVLADNRPKPMTPVMIAKTLGRRKTDSIRQLLRKMTKEGTIMATDEGYSTFS